MIRLWQAAWTDGEFHYYVCQCGHRNNASGYAFGQDRCPACNMVFEDDVNKLDITGIATTQFIFRG